MVAVGVGGLRFLSGLPDGIAAVPPSLLLFSSV